MRGFVGAFLGMVIGFLCLWWYFRRDQTRPSATAISTTPWREGDQVRLTFGEPLTFRPAQHETITFTPKRLKGGILIRFNGKDWEEVVDADS